MTATVRPNAFENGAVYYRNGKTNESASTGINQVGCKKAPAKLQIYSINGVKVAEVNKVSDVEYVLFSRYVHLQWQEVCYQVVNG